MANILITGVTGLLGKHIATRLVRDGCNSIYGIARSKREQSPKIKQYICGVLGEPTTYQKLPTNVDICIHTAAAIPSREDVLGQSECIQSNILGTFELIKYLCSCSPNVYVIHISTIYVYKPFDNEIKTELSVTMPDTFYGLSKLYSEAIVLKSNLKSCILRLSSFYDSKGEASSHQRLLYDWIERAKKGKDLVIWGTGEEKRNYLHVEDAVDVIEQAINMKPKGIFNIASSEMLTMSEIATTIIKQIQSDSKKVIDATKSVYAPISAVSIAKAQKHLNFQPKISLAEGIKRVISYEKM